MGARRRHDKRGTDLPDEAVDWLYGGKGGAWYFFQSAEHLRELWHEHEEVVVAEHVAEWPGSRPCRWWQLSAPEPRRRLGGIGTPNFEVLAHAPSYWYGVPCGWVTQWEVDYYNGRAVDVHGQPIRDGYKDGDFTGIAVDLDDPPIYEAEATFLERHGLLLAGERRRLTPGDFEPESIVDIIEPGHE